MLIYEDKPGGLDAQYRAIDEEAIRTAHFVRNKCRHLWIDMRGFKRSDRQGCCAQLARALNAQARQSAADCAWAVISRFYEKCRNHKSGKRGYPKFQHDGRSAVSNTCQLVKSVRDTSGGRFILWHNTYEALHESPVIGVEPACTIQDSSACGIRIKKLRRVRMHIRLACGVALDCDHNAALNIQEKTLEEYARTWGHQETAPSTDGDNASAASTFSGCKPKTGKRAGERRNPLKRGSVNAGRCWKI